MKKPRTWGKSRSLRLRHVDYAAPYQAYHVILGSVMKGKMFTESTLNAEVVRILKEASERYGYQLIAYCLMPDHLHILVQAAPGCQNLTKYVGGFKSYSTRRAGRKLWQRGFYEHIMRSDEALLKVAEYILNNPVRKGIVRRREEYPWGDLVV